MHSCMNVCIKMHTCKHVQIDWHASVKRVKQTIKMLIERRDEIVSTTRRSTQKCRIILIYNLPVECNPPSSCASLPRIIVFFLRNTDSSPFLHPIISWLREGGSLWWREFRCRPSLMVEQRECHTHRTALYLPLLLFSVSLLLSSPSHHPELLLSPTLRLNHHRPPEKQWTTEERTSEKEGNH